MKEILKRLQELVNYEINRTNDTIMSFSVKCEISYQEMRRIVNGTARDIKISTICKICSHTEIKMMDVILTREDLDIIVRYQNERYNVKVRRC